MIFPRFSKISPRFFWSEIHQKPDNESIEFYLSMESLDIPNKWQKLADDDSQICNEIFANLATTRMGHSGGSWGNLVRWYQEIAKNGVPDRFLVKNEKFWVRGYYIPDYFSKFLFAAGVFGIIAALKFN
jgi:hypothetical protein